MKMNERRNDSEDGYGIDIVIHQGSDKKAPSCPHGPTLLFEKVNKGEESGRRFYACSACRDRKDCNFFQWEDEKVSEARQQAREEENRSKRPPFTHVEYTSRFREFVSLPLDQRRFCVDCQVLLLPRDWDEHSNHHAELSDEITVARLRRPSLLLCPLENKKSNAQYLFADRSCHFLLDMLSRLGFRKILCVGTPRLHELIKLRNVEGTSETTRSLLLDIDFRYSQFYGQDEFCHYNMFNHHFFGGKEPAGVFLDFLREEEGSKVVMVTDPPFGGLVKPLAHSFRQMADAWRGLQSCTTVNSQAEMPMVWIFPYFFEARIVECFSSFTMLDYQVDYDNHALYKHGKTGRKQSPVRLFTNLPARDVVLPEEEGYRFCAICERYVSARNKHCPECNACPSKDGREWKHCDDCRKCVKPSWQHCTSCGRCALPDHPCRQGQTGCFNCGSLQHKHRACPDKLRPQLKGKSRGSSRPTHTASRSSAKKRSRKAQRKKKRSVT
ncbi:rRNA N6-adenosine-methyltransferase ZCCHC4 [Clupea harengus]|uniref:rRNA N(6)-adenosine-methyltransferase ZCCHC4 n=1 Tax=Clupea harengus TaxID=7950 RepID=A0A6P8H1N2_CLUHA|nr:rRNA N6-adenosine-methyltransferase ZCCHC4 [Clupea harengus]